MSNWNAPAGPCCEILDADVIAQRVAHGGSNVATVNHLGMTKREAFAMAAMQGLIPAISDKYVSFREVAAEAVEMANKLLKALEEDNEKENI